MLVETLGLEPGDQLRDLERAILRHDPSLSAPVAAGELPPSVPTAEERKVVTVLFADVVGSTELVVGQDPEQARALLDRLFDAAADRIEEAGGTIEKFIGDAVVAVFGAPVAQEDHAERALHTALALRRRTAEIFGDTVALGIGVATGEVVAGRAREGGAVVTGAAVNLAARLEQAADAGEILVDPRTVRAARSAFEFGPDRLVEAKGFTEGAPCRPLRRALALTRARPAGVFVGRQRELELLRATYHRVAEDSRPALVTVVGEAGVGKSSLVRRFWDWLAVQEPEPLRRTGSCLSYGRGITYRPLGEVLREELGLLETDPPEEIRSRLADRSILALALGLEPESELHPLAAREALHEALVAFLDDLAAAQPAVVLLEDLHWAEEPLLDLVERAVRDVSAPVLMVVTTRPELTASRPSWGAASRDGATIWLDPLSAADTELLVEELAMGRLPAALCELLVERSEGNPFFAEELLATFAEQGFEAEPSVPDSLRTVLSARIDLLPQVEKDALQAAAVIGRRFWRGALHELLEGATPDFGALERRDFIRRRSTSSLAGEREFTFKHALTRDVAYQAIPKAKRARLHADFAAWLERVGGGRDEHASMLAHHFAEAARAEGAAPEGALRWLRRAAELAIGRYELDEAVALAERALELAPDDAARCDLWRLIGHASGLKYDGSAFVAALERALELAPDTEIRADIASDLAVQAFFRRGMWTSGPRTESVRMWVAEALAGAAPGSPTRVKALVAAAYADPLNVEAAEEAAAIAEQLGDPTLRVWALDGLGTVAMATGPYELASTYAMQRLELLDQIDDPDLRADMIGVPVRTCIATCRFEQARELALLHDEATRTLTPHHRMHGVAIVLEVEETVGCWERVLALEQRVRDAVVANAATPCVRNARSLLVCALAAAYLGDDGHARELEAEADALGHIGRHVIDTPRLALAVLRGDRDRAEELLSSILEGGGWYAHGHGSSMATLSTQLDAAGALDKRDVVEECAPPLLVPGSYIEPFALRALGRVRHDAALLERATATFTAAGLEWHARETNAMVVVST